MLPFAGDGSYTFEFVAHNNGGYACRSVCADGCHFSFSQGGHAAMVSRDDQNSIFEICPIFHVAHERSQCCVCISKRCFLAIFI